MNPSGLLLTRPSSVARFDSVGVITLGIVIATAASIMAEARLLIATGELKRDPD
jgi:hypothetical protein